jgi:hypothetical protein
MAPRTMAPDPTIPVGMAAPLEVAAAEVAAAEELSKRASNIVRTIALPFVKPSVVTHGAVVVGLTLEAAVVAAPAAEVAEVLAEERAEEMEEATLAKTIRMSSSFSWLYR